MGVRRSCQIIKTSANPSRFYLDWFDIGLTPGSKQPRGFTTELFDFHHAALPTTHIVIKVWIMHALLNRNGFAYFERKRWSTFGMPAWFMTVIVRVSFSAISGKRA